jgi:uncharacterized protein
MRGIPGSFLIYFFVFVIIIEILSYFGVRILIFHSQIKYRKYLTSIYVFISLSATALLFYSFSNPELIRQSRSYTLFFVVISVTFLNLFPKVFFAVMTIISFLTRVIVRLHSQVLVLAGALLLGCGLIVITFYGILVGRYDIHVEKRNLYFPDLPEQMDGYKIVQISDIHMGRFGKNPKVMIETVKIIEQLQPDLLLFTGDIVNNFGEEIVGFEPYLKHLSGKYGKYAIQGNHDYGDYFNWPDTLSKRDNLNLIKADLTDAGFTLLQNQWQKIIVKDTSFSLIGVENWGHKPFPQYANLEVAMKGIAENSFKILMSHDPAHWRAKVIADTNIQLTLSGHTHGGQFGMKFAGIEFSPIYLNEKNWGGLYQSENQFLYVNRGLGTVGFPGRIEMRPEITLLTLFRSNGH